MSPIHRLPLSHFVIGDARGVTTLMTRGDYLSSERLGDCHAVTVAFMSLMHLT